MSTKIKKIHNFFFPYWQTVLDSLKQMCEVSCKLPDMLIHHDRTTALQLKDCEITMSKTKCKQAISEMFFTTSKFTVECLNGYCKKYNIKP